MSKQKITSQSKLVFSNLASHRSLTPNRALAAPAILEISNLGSHDILQGCEDPGCFSQMIDYQGVTLNQIKGLIGLYQKFQIFKLLFFPVH